MKHSASNMTAFLNNGEPGCDLRPGAVEKFIKAIKDEGDAKTRAQAWDLLIFLNSIRYSDKHTTRILKDEVIIKAIIEYRLRDHNGEEWVFLNILARDVSPQILHKFDKELSSLLNERPYNELCQIIAKGKCYSAKPILEKLLQDEEDSKEHLEIALAAFGNEKLEDKFISK